MMDHGESRRALAVSAAVASRPRSRRLPGTERAPPVNLPRDDGSGRPQRRGCGMAAGGAAERDADAV